MMEAAVKPGDVAVVHGAGTIGMMTALAAVAGGCSRVYITDLLQPKLDIAARFESVVPVNIAEVDAKAFIGEETDGWGADIVFEASGNERAVASVFDYICPGGRVVLIGMPVEPVKIDVVQAQAKEARVETIFRYANVYPRALSLMESGKIDLKPLITETFSFNESIEAYDYAVDPKPTSVKIQIRID